MSFIARQIKAFRKGGVPVLFHKVNKAFRLFCLNICAPLAVQLGLDWPWAYLFVGRKLFGRYKRMSFQKHVDLVKIGIVRDKMLACFEKYSVRQPDLEGMGDWVEANRLVEGFYRNRGDFQECSRICNRVAGVQRTFATAHQLDKLNIAFIPRAFAEGSIGVYENLCAYIKGEILSGRTPARKMLLLAPPETPINNPSYLGYWRRYVTVISNPLLIKLLSPLEKVLTVPLAFLMPFREQIYISHYLSLGLIREAWEKERKVSLLTLSKEDEARGWERLRHLGLREGDWFVCLHVREPGWCDHNSPAEDFRNADIETYLPAIEAITARGGWVFRMGNQGMKPLPKIARVIDYARSDARSDSMDVFLSAKCRFFMGTSSGLYTFAMAFGVPVVMTNMLPPYNIYCFTSKDLFIPRLCRSKREDRYLDFNEFFTPPVGTACGRHYEMLDLEVVPNDPEAIKDLVLEMLERCDGSLKYSRQDESLQEQFRAITETCSVFYGAGKVPVNARIGRDFLLKYSALLSGNGIEKEENVSLQKQ